MAMSSEEFNASNNRILAAGGGSEEERRSDGGGATDRSSALPPIDPPAADTSTAVLLERLLQLAEQVESINREMEKLSVRLRQKQFAAQDTILSGVGDGIRQIAEEAGEHMQTITQEYERWLETLREETRGRRAKSFRIARLDKFGEVGKAGLIWLLLIAGAWLVIKYLL